MGKKDTFILAIESSCDDTSAAVLKNETILSNLIAGQAVHEQYGGVVPELASRAHLKHIVPVVDQAIKKAGIELNDLDAIAFTKGPGLMGSLLVGVSYAKALAMSLGVPLIDVNHMYAHVLAHFIDDADREKPEFPFICLTVSGGHTQIVLVRDHLEMEVIGTTKDDAAGEAFDKAARLLGIEYPGGAEMDKLARMGDKNRFKLPEPKAPGLNMSFSGLKTSFQYLLRDELKKDEHFIEKNKEDLCASMQGTIVDILIKKIIEAARLTGIRELALAGGVSANSSLRESFRNLDAKGFKTYIPPFEFCTDNAAMIAITGYFKYQKGSFSDNNASSLARYPLGT